MQNAGPVVAKLQKAGEETRQSRVRQGNSGQGSWNTGYNEEKQASNDTKLAVILLPQGQMKNMTECGRLSQFFVLHGLIR